MASSKPFIFAHAPFVPSIICDQCGQNMHCMRRVPGKQGEIRTFECACGNFVLSEAGAGESDEAIQREAERLTGRAS